MWMPCLVRSSDQAEGPVVRLGHELVDDTTASRSHSRSGPTALHYRRGAIYVANTEKATIVRIPVEKGGSAGTPEIAATVTGFDPVSGPPAQDGIALNLHGTSLRRLSTRVGSCG